MPSEKKYRVTRTLEYVGTEEWIRRTLSRSYVRPKAIIYDGVISETSVSIFQEVKEGEANHAKNRTATSTASTRQSNYTEDNHPAAEDD